jgi:hypothetical protein
MSFNYYARKARDPRQLRSIRAGALKSCIRHLASLTKQSYRETCSRFAARFHLEDLHSLSEGQLLDLLSAVELERNTFLERLRAFERTRLREKWRGKYSPRRADIDALYGGTPRADEASTLT